VWLSLTARQASSGSIALIEEIAARVAQSERLSRKQARGKAGLVNLKMAVGAIVGALLRQWAKSRPAFRSRKAEEFTGAPIGYRTFCATMDALISCGLVREAAGIRYGLGFASAGGTEAFKGRPARYWPSAELLRMARRHGLSHSTIKADFVDVFPTAAPKVEAPVILTTLKEWGEEKRLLPLSPDDPQAARVTAQVEQFNAWAAEHTVTGCAPPRWSRRFTATWQLGGRWYAAGADGAYQRLSPADRLRIRIDGEPVAEVDIRAAQLSIAHGLLGLTLPEGDPYTIPGVPREVAKQWIVATFGKGSSVRHRWPESVKQNEPTIASFPPDAAASAITERYPFLADPAPALANAAGLDTPEMRAIGQPAKLLTHRLMAIEANAITGTMEVMRGRGILVLPVHDSLIVPVSAVQHAEDAITSAFKHLAKVRVVTKVEMHADAN
jgi:hypothetical protein